ncbi:hypothetical protein D0Z03_002705 [Geotrichum reessii]|nr:hypothetical protein D0Z03_002705 [Galactomyces reessii]
MSRPLTVSTSWLRAPTAQVFRQSGAFPAPAGFHTSSSAAALSRHEKAQQRIHKHFARQLQKPKTEVVDPILGRANVPFLERLKARVAEPTNISFGLEEENIEKLMFGAEHARLLRTSEATSATVIESEAQKREAVRRILSMQNSGLVERKKLARRYAAEEFARFEGDTGSSEVQAAINTVNILFLVNHIKENKGDRANMRKLQILVHDRQAILKYLKRSKPERYYWAIEKLGLTDEAVTQEFSLSRRYLEQFQFFGANTLPVRDNKKERTLKAKLADLEKHAQKYLRN